MLWLLFTAAIAGGPRDAHALDPSSQPRSSPP